ncbi:MULTISPECIES: chromosome segregation protein SMC [Bacillus]|uniref:Chromosome partition protein Smc n=1 Tax=Bacillus glycinifermentans TaxID=1664069 RepID=A0AAJ3Z068_9BACI|nr:MULTISPECIES: chromosome segregation protein SMC [Bacillus]KKB75631.1 chromosome segregation protein SMC [Bacillus sp. TH008]MDU0071334.1 chromosome segregation protein SMC [Bacillus sp. IG6]MED8019151.1 chromosome segregation protein SMC [Bacillus glycinifermentans]QAT65090.1 chromosome segregation protein SMC [Bacillus glycinifermentans]WKB79062.1 chromosome segregation protein SMC [Bacillus glycinifermentans]
MFLKRLDVIGFKSFAERISVDFVKGVTAVVGPNGSGKSNITDAIRWVLGEQSAKSLRGGKMEDIIFAGSDSRKKLNLAEVTLTLDNEDHFLPIDFHEVSVTRRVYRSGESEFLINNQSCRLKDIIDLFMDSGLGKEAFSIISQGKVEEILSSKAEERRSIFEEAAGVLKYKTRKKKAENKLFETQDNLNRVEDILHELESQVEPLKMQASIAKDYLEKKDELEKIEIALTAYDIEELHQKWEALKQKVEKAKDEEMASSSAIQAKEAKIEEARDKIQALDESVDELQQVLLLTSEELEKLEGRKEVLKERKKNASQNRAQLEDTIAQRGEKENSLKEKIAAQKLVFEKLQAEAKGLAQEVKEKTAALSVYSENVEEEIEQLKSDYFELLNEQASLRNELQFLDDQMSQSKAAQKRLADNNEKYLSERRDIAEQKAKAEHEFGLFEERLAQQIKAYRDAQKNYELKKNEYEKKESALYQAYQYVQQARSKKEMLEAMQEDFSGFYQGVKEVLKARSELAGIHGAIAELVKTDERYETAVEIALGASAQHVVTENEDAARQAIQYLKKHSSGRATFLPLSVIKERSIQPRDIEAAKEHPAFIGIASELVSFDPVYRTVVQNLLGTVLITEHLKGANELAKRLGHRYRIVTLEGDVVNPGGSMTGGAVKKKNNSLLGRNRELETAAERLKVMEEKTEALEAEVKSLKQAIQKLERELQSLREDGERLRAEQQEIKGRLYELEIAEKNVNSHLELYDEEKSALLKEDDEKKQRKAELEEKLSAMSESLKALDGKIESLTERKQTQTSTKEALQSELTDLKVVLAKTEQSCANEREKLARLEEEFAENEEALKIAKEDLSLLTNEMSSSTSGEEKLEEAAKKKLNDKNKTAELIASRREQRMKLQQGLETEELELKEMKRQYKQMAGLLKDEEVKLGRMEVELDNLLSFLREEYGLSFEWAKEKYPLELSPEEARKRVKLIKLAIEELGTVNLGSIEEYERVNERYVFLTEQRDDLLEAKNTLFQVIEEMDEEMTKRFSDTFQQIRSHFEDVFRALFGGGRAELNLTDPNDLLQSGVDIIAQPPGKKLQNLSLLSGGERALTAIALLFSILKVRPVPFCVLDEVEAALDEANVFRFAQYLKKYSHETQFIVITHRKGTMEEADVLYGVTMQESGVSKLVSVKLEDTKELVQ